ncbi:MULTISPECIES: SDR family NAD(P)-dependent oxidoreductase [unclassified Ruegeria]|uniref:SDR family NAD(P)-dependent oxidoreductase n=1 Tax=unclassified Ruegeria TaxID=2625375 RepID=UPI0014881BF6|nr:MULTISPECIES: SDR family NAD(P)-dependent oxidoreductase [unclassified Ruegeria]NOD36424.1 SDR family NAD(P)-dependent oxidoreductase [Ruegeria sp. HKCCD7296]NOE35517.1 SDR family NAD(P)-dependent oxidoreductase [Ruegeria sp. HKCCD7318]NOE42533.1 SDR family NAD(P)-dependent oxidoreductase [Ruegeria sp. HKCCD7319]
MQKSILITGCSSGIGLDAAHGMRARGWRVFASCRQQRDCDRLRAQGFESPKIDYTDTKSITSGLSSVLEATGGTLDALFNNGAHGLPGAVEDVPTDGLRHIFETNVFGWHELTRQVIPVMREQGYGRIVQCSSVLGLVAFPWRGAYVATKYAIEGLTDTMRLELRDTGIHVVLIEPGPITSKLREKAIPMFERFIDWESSALREKYEASLLKRLYESSGPDRFELPASAVTDKLAHAAEARRPKARYYVTTPTYVAGILRRILPTKATDRILSDI